MQQFDAGPAALDRNFVARLSDEDQTYILQRETEWEGSFAAERDKVMDGLQACSDYNRQLQELRTP